jgi:hypothetical protein
MSDENGIPDERQKVADMLADEVEQTVEHTLAAKFANLVERAVEMATVRVLEGLPTQNIEVKPVYHNKIDVPKAEVKFTAELPKQEPAKIMFQGVDIPGLRQVILEAGKEQTKALVEAIRGLKIQADVTVTIEPKSKMIDLIRDKDQRIVGAKVRVG